MKPSFQCETQDPGFRTVVFVATITPASSYIGAFTCYHMSASIRTYVCTCPYIHAHAYIFNASNQAFVDTVVRTPYIALDARLVDIDRALSEYQALANAFASINTQSTMNSTGTGTGHGHGHGHGSGSGRHSQHRHQSSRRHSSYSPTTSRSNVGSALTAGEGSAAGGDKETVYDALFDFMVQSYYPYIHLYTHPLNHSRHLFLLNHPKHWHSNTGSLQPASCHNHTSRASLEQRGGGELLMELVIPARSTQTEERQTLAFLCKRIPDRRSSTASALSSAASSSSSLSSASSRSTSTASLSSLASTQSRSQHHGLTHAHAHTHAKMQGFIVRGDEKAAEMEMREQKEREERVKEKEEKKEKEKEEVEEREKNEGKRVTDLVNDFSRFLFTYMLSSDSIAHV